MADSPWGFPAIDGDDLFGVGIKVEGLGAGIEFVVKGPLNSNKKIIHKVEKLKPILVV